MEPIAGGVTGRLTLWRTLRSPSPAECEHFARALRAAEGLGHGIFPPVLDVGHDAAREALWAVRPWMNGESLPSMIGGLHDVGLDIPYLQVLAEQLAQGLDGAHAAGLVHGRLRASRVLVAAGPRLTLLDMGWEAFRREHAQDWLRAPTVGTDYRAPEFTDTGALPASVDIYAFGLIVRDLLATRHDGAWKGRWESWVERTTDPEPSQRFGSAAEALRALRPILRSLPDPLPPPPENYEPGAPDPLTLSPR